jgi:hypothetical protein
VRILSGKRKKPESCSELPDYAWNMPDNSQKCPKQLA